MHAKVDLDDESIGRLGRDVLEVEAEAILALQARIGPAFVSACRFCLECEGRVVVTGMGKSGHVAGKIAATLASTGTPSFFVHPGEASHGDLGMITPTDVVLAISNSGETPEVLTILPLIKRLGVPLIAMTGRPESTIAMAADAHLDVGVSKEACPLNLAPTASTTATLAMGDALAVALLNTRGFTREDFAFSHPGGQLGRRLLLHVRDVMRTGDRVPKVAPDLVVSEGLFEISRKGLGMTAVVDADDRVLGIYTDGDLRRTLDARRELTTTPIGEVMTRNVKTVRGGILAAEAVRLMETHAITALLVVDDGDRLVGAFNVHDLLQAGVM
ncbi:MAG TPA: KpsF/GutQ family sugar-phosphate isomerase [Gammaproteobacteria bacterium]|nr:KpsF/GutQ family sugar-phosphate isomerase [Gammaproteobacteria bacterium]